jgi:hypothetical protein
MVAFRPPLVLQDTSHETLVMGWACCGQFYFSPQGPRSESGRLIAQLSTSSQGLRLISNLTCTHRVEACVSLIVPLWVPVYVSGGQCIVADRSCYAVNCGVSEVSR